MRLRNREAAFTLIELMIAMAIGAFAMALMYGMFTGTQRASKSQQDAVEMLDNGRIAIDLIMKDVRNTGFLVPSVNSVRIENDCGNSGNKIDYNTGTFAWTIGASASGTSVNAGDFPAFTTAPSGSRGKCPAGSDRITLVMKPDMLNADTCNQYGCLNNNSGQGTVIRLPCDGATPGSPPSTGNCQITLDKMMPNQNLSCSGGANVTLPSVIYVTTCQADDPTKCGVLPVDKYQCDQSCPISGSGSGKLLCLDVHLNSFSGSAWNFDGGAKDGLDTNGVTFRTYQIMDYDGDGTTELVYSDMTEAALLQPTPVNTINPQWVVVANDIDDLQFAWQASSSGTFSQTSLFDFPSCKTSSSNPVNTFGNCLQEVYTGGAFVGGSTLGPTSLAAIRVSMISRSERRSLGATVGTDSFEKFARAPLENNNPALQPYNPASAVTYGCTAANYAVCSGNGNAEGFKRRVLTETVGLRNTVGFAF